MKLPSSAESVDKFLSEAYRDCHDRSLFDLGKTIGIKDAGVKVEREQVETVLRTPWNGKNYSARIWKNAKKLGDVIQKEIVGGMHRGADVEEMTRNVMRAMNVGKKEAVRLVRTELNYVQNRAIARSIEDSGLEWYRFVAVLDGRTSPMCRAHDGKEYRLDDYVPGTNAPPLHPHCRSMIIASFGDDESISSLRSARDRKGNYIRVPAEMRYNDWQRIFINKEMTLPQWEAKHLKGNLPKDLTLHAGNSVELRLDGEPTFLGTINVANEEEVRKTIEWAENRIVNEPIEHAVIITSVGSVYECVGDENNVNPKVGNGETLEGAIITHNHPSENPYNEHSFSDDDIEWFLGMKLAILRGIDDKYIYELNRNPKDLDKEPVTEEVLMQVKNEIDMYLARHASVIKEARQNHIGYRRWVRKRESKAK